MLFLTVYHNDECIKTYQFKEAPITLGRLPENEISIASIGISRRHFRIEKEGVDSYAVVDLNSLNGTFVNEKKVTRGTLQNNDKISVGKYSVLFEYIAEADEFAENPEENSSNLALETPTPAPTSSPTLVDKNFLDIEKEEITSAESFKEVQGEVSILIETNKHIIYKLDKNIMSLGNSEHDDIFVDGFLITDEHVLIERSQEETWIYSNKMMGRFKINGKKTNRHKLLHKDKIEIGSSTFRFMEHGQK